MKIEPFRPSHDRISGVSAPAEDADVETASAEYARRFDSPVGRWMIDKQLEATLYLLRDKGPSTILDVGGGHGQTASALARAGHRVTVLASSAAAVAESLRPAIGSGLVRLVVGALREPPVEPRSFEVVLSYRLMAHAHDVPSLVAGLARTAERTVIVDYVTSRSFNAAADLLFAAKKRLERNTRPFRVMRDAEIDHYFMESGCRRRDRHPEFFWPMALHRALNSLALSKALEAPAASLGLKRFLGSPVIARFDRV